MTQEQFITAHVRICSRQYAKKAKYRSPSRRRWCARNLYDYLIVNKLSLDIYYSQKQKTLATSK